MNDTSIESQLAGLGPLPMNYTKADIAARRKQLEHIRQGIGRLLKRLDAERDYLFSICEHADSYSSNWCGRDPGGGGCNTCGMSW